MKKIFYFIVFALILCICSFGCMVYPEAYQSAYPYSYTVAPTVVVPVQAGFYSPPIFWLPGPGPRCGGYGPGPGRRPGPGPGPCGPRRRGR